jgi:Saxitoxin biosynthesis operon protein SxtJ
VAQRIHARLTAPEGRRFAFTVGGAFLALAAIALWRGRQITPAVLGTIGGLLILAGVAVPTRLGPVQRGWMGLAHAISKVTTPIVLAVMYFVVIVPAGLVMRLAGRKSLARPRNATTYWVTRERTTRSAEDMQHQF